MFFYPTERIALFIDGANLYATAKALGFDIDYKNLLGVFRSKGYLVRALYYTALIEDQEYSSIRPLIDWLDYNGYTMVTKPTKEFTDASGRRKIKGNMDIELTVDAMELAAKLDHVVLFSGDGDFRSLVAALQGKGLRVSVVSTLQTQPPMVADELRRQADQFIDIADLRRKSAAIRASACPVKRARPRLAQFRAQREGVGSGHGPTIRWICKRSSWRADVSPCTVRRRRRRRQRSRAPAARAAHGSSTIAFAIVTPSPNGINAPVASFGAADARLLIVGLAPGVRGANRTGRPVHRRLCRRSLYATLLETGLAARPLPRRPGDGLTLVDARITNAVRCVPPQNKPTPAEIATCRDYLAATIRAMPRLGAILVLGRIAHESTLAALGQRRAAFPFGARRAPRSAHIRARAVSASTAAIIARATIPRPGA